MTSFVMFMISLVVVVAILAVKARRSRVIDQKTEKTAKESLLAVGSVVERRYQERHGSPAPLPPAGWYPAKKGAHRAAP